MARISVIGLTGNSVFMRVPHFHAGGETVHATDFHYELGGKGFNQAVAAARQGAEVSFLTAVGADDVEKVRAFLSAEGIKGMVVGKATPSAHATILTDGTGETRVTVFPGARLDVSDVEPFAEAIASADILLLTNEVPEDVNLRAAEIASAAAKSAALPHEGPRSAGVKIILNPAPARALPTALSSRVSIFTPNEFEIVGLENVPGEVVETLGAKGCRIRSTGKVIPALPCGEAVDTTGAGDTFNGVLAVRLAEGRPLAEACAEANAAAARSVTVRYVLPSIPHRHR